MINVLTREDFVETIPRFTLTNLAHASWMADTAELKEFNLVGNQLQVHVSQQPVMEGVSSFSILGQQRKSIGYVGHIFFLEFEITNAFGNFRALRLYSNGHAQIWLGLKSGGGFRHVHFISTDGIRMRISTGPNASKVDVSTIYLREPAYVYSLGQMNEKSLKFRVNRANKVYQVEETKPLRQLERTIIQQGNKYDSGRIGAEIAYAVSKDKLGLKELVIVEPAKGGKDLYTKDGKVVIQARMLRAGDQPARRPWSETLQYELNQMVWKLVKQDFPNNPLVNRGYAMLSYTDSADIISTVVLEVIPPLIRPSQRRNPRAK